MVNGGCIFYQFGSYPYVFGLGLVEGEKRTKIEEEQVQQWMPWFARFSDLLTRTSYRQKWYRDVIMQFEIQNQPFIKSFFTILANLAFCSLNYEDARVKDVLKGKFKELLQFEVDRDYKKELESQMDLKKLLNELNELAEKQAQIKANLEEKKGVDTTDTPQLSSPRKEDEQNDIIEKGQVGQMP